MVRLGWAALVLLGGCGGDESSPPASPSPPSTASTVCDRYSAFAVERGCKALTSCQLDAKCAAQVDAWLACIKRDTSQCLCEKSDGDLNCEGSWKPNEGPALCVTEHAQVESCLGP